MSGSIISEQLVEAHDRAQNAIMWATDCSEEQAEEVITALVSLVFETMKLYLPGEDTCN